jgi:hypothetical protein
MSGLILNHKKNDFKHDLVFCLFSAQHHVLNYYSVYLLMIDCRLRYTFLDQIICRCICQLLLALYHIGLQSLDRQMMASVVFIICLLYHRLIGKTQHLRRQSKVSILKIQTSNLVKMVGYQQSYGGVIRDDWFF